MKLFAYRELIGKTQQQIADELDVTALTVWRWEAGRQTPRPDDLRKIAAWSKNAVTANDFIEPQAVKP